MTGAVMSLIGGSVDPLVSSTLSPTTQSLSNMTTYWETTVDTTATQVGGRAPYSATLVSLTGDSFVFASSLSTTLTGLTNPFTFRFRKNGSTAPTTSTARISVADDTGQGVASNTVSLS